jgi:predicted ribosomally synthesized peptide with nif11-like leader
MGDTARLQTSPLQAISEKQLQAFQEAVKADTSLQEKLKAAADADADADADAVVSMTKAAGFVISAEELTQAQVELSDEELAGVAGGDRECFRT